MTNVVSRDNYNIPAITYDGQLNVGFTPIGDAEDFKRFRDQVMRSGVFVIRRSDPTAADSIFFGMVDTPTNVLGYRIYTHPSGMQVTFVTIANPANRPTEMLYSGVTKTFAATT